MSPLIHPRLLESLVNHYPSLCQIKTYTVTRETTGEEIATWSTLPGHEAIRCYVSRRSQQGAEEVGAGTWTHSESQRVVALAGHYPAIKEKMHVLIDLVEWDIVGVQHDSQGVSTNLIIERVE